MTLYATVSSERASKGQGGNEYLNIEILDASQEVVATAYITHNGEKTIIEIVYDSMNANVYAEAKGEKQKGERICKQCGARVKTSLEVFHCSSCGADN